MNYEEASNFDINAAVCRIVKNTKSLIQRGLGDTAIYGDGVLPVEFDPCNNWADSGPISLENKISLDWTGDGIWGALGNDGSMFSCSNYADKNPLKAAMIVFLKTQEQEQC